MGRVYYLPMLLLLAVGLGGCQKREKEAELVDSAELTPAGKYLNPEGSVIGEWVLVKEFVGAEPSAYPVVGVNLRLNRDSSWNYEGRGFNLMGTKFRNAFQPQTSSPHSAPHWALYLERQDTTLMLHYRLTDSSLNENFDLTGAVGSPLRIWKLKSRR